MKHLDYNFVKKLNFQDGWDKILKVQSNESLVELEETPPALRSVPQDNYGGK